MLPEDDDAARQRVLDEDSTSTLTWDCWAKGLNDAKQQMYDFCGFGIYEPMLRSDGTPYPEDELDYHCVGCDKYFSHKNRCPYCDTAASSPRSVPGSAG